MSNVSGDRAHYMWSFLDDPNLRSAAQVIQDGSGYRIARVSDFAANINLSGSTVEVGEVGVTGANGLAVNVLTYNGYNAFPVALVSGAAGGGSSLVGLSGVLGNILTITGLNGFQAIPVFQPSGSKVEGLQLTGFSGTMPRPVLGGGLVVTGVSGTYANGTIQFSQQDQYGNTWVSLGTALSAQVDSVTVAITGSGSANQLVIDSQGRITTVQSSTRYGITGSNGVAIAVDSLGRQTTLLGDPRFGISGSGTTNVASVDAEGRVKTLTSLTPVTSGGLSTYRNINLTETGISIKATPGQIYGWFITNRSTSERFIRLFDTNGTPNNGVMTPIDTLVFPGSTAANVAFPNGVTFVSGIGIAASATLADNTSGSLSQNDLVVNIYYK